MAGTTAFVWVLVAAAVVGVVGVVAVLARARVDIVRLRAQVEQRRDDAA